MALALYTPLAVKAYLGTFSRPLADDFCTWGWLNELGFWGSQAYWYQNWSGRFSFTALMTASHYLGPSLPSILPLILLSSWVIATLWAVWPLFEREKRGRRALYAVPLAGALLGGVFGAAPNLYQTLYWHTGSLTYVLPLILFTVFVGWLVRQDEEDTVAEGQPWSVESAIAASAAFVVSGFSETFALLQVVILLLVALALWFSKAPTKSRLVFSGFLGAMLGLLVVVLAPGNAVRASLVATPDSILLVLQRSFRDAYIFSAQMVNHQSPVLLMLGLVPLAVGCGSGREKRLTWPWIAAIVFMTPVLAFLGIVVVMLPSEYALSSYPDGRVLVNATFVVSAAIVGWALVIGLSLGPSLRGPRWLRTGFGFGLVIAALIVCGVQGVRAIDQDLELLPDARQFATAWDRRHGAVLEVRSRGDFELAVASLRHMGGLAEISRDSSRWINRCFADAYGVRSVQAK